ncbi:MAG: Tim44/TimA family putative adaptor protein [Rhizomicrobium sp.]
MANSQILEIGFLALVAGVILFRLYTVLGRRTGHERPPQDAYRFQPNPDAPQPIVDDKAAALPQSARTETADGKPADPVARGVAAIRLADKAFETEHFLSGARQAYEMIVTAFAKGDRAILRPLLSDEVYSTFDGAISARETAKEKVAFTFEGFKDAKIVEASLGEPDRRCLRRLRRAIHLGNQQRKRRSRRRRRDRRARSDGCMDLRPRHTRARSELDAGSDLRRIALI